MTVGLAGAPGTALHLLRAVLQLEGATVAAVYDPDRARAARAVAALTAAGRPTPKVESSSLERFCQTPGIELVLNFAGPEQSVGISLAALGAGRPVAALAPAAQTLEECWALVEASRRSGCDAILLDPSCYSQESLLVLNLIASGVLGEPLFAETSEPAAAGWWLDIHRGDRIEYLVALDSAEVGNTLMHTARGRVICSSRYRSLPYSEGLVRVQGTRGVYSGAIHQIYVEGRSPVADTFEAMDGYEEYQSPVWKTPASLTPESLALRRLIHNVAHRLAPDSDVFDLAVWSALPILARTSASRRGEPADCPDFTRGQWRRRSSIDPGRIA